MKFASRDELWAWFAAEHAACDELWVEFAKKGTGIPSVVFADALEIALCFGWIDGIRKTSDEEGFFRQRFTPRRKRSKWSQINREKAEALIASGAMQPAGLAEVERAKADGRWDAAYPPASKVGVPPDLQEALDANPAAREFFATLTGSNRYAILYRVHDAKRPETRARRIAHFVEMLARGETLH